MAEQSSPTMRLSDEQVAVLLRGIQPSRVQSLDGMSYVETWDIRAMMNRVFGFCGWSLISTSPTTLVFERETKVGKDQKPGFKVAYKAELELIVHLRDGDARYAGSAIGEAVMPDYKLGDAHDMAAKSAESGALKRAATNLGDQFGLSLYNGTTDPVVKRVIGFNPPDRPSGEQRAPTVRAAGPDEPEHPSSGADQGQQVRPPAPADPSANETIKHRVDALTPSQKIAYRRLCQGSGITEFMDPPTEQLDHALVLLGRIEKGE